MSGREADVDWRLIDGKYLINFGEIQTVHFYFGAAAPDFGPITKAEFCVAAAGNPGEHVVAVSTDGQWLRNLADEIGKTWFEIITDGPKFTGRVVNPRMVAGYQKAPAFLDGIDRINLTNILGASLGAAALEQVVKILKDSIPEITKLGAANSSMFWCLQKASFPIFITATMHRATTGATTPATTPRFAPIAPAIVPIKRV